MTPTRLLDPATTAVDDAVATVRYDRLDPADLAAVIAGLQELFWHTTTLTAVIAHAYNTTDDLGHDTACDPHRAVTAITAGLQHVAGLLAEIDALLNGVHNHAAHLHHRR
jgi:hypothetical protein